MRPRLAATCRGIVAERVELETKLSASGLGTRRHVTVTAEVQISRSADSDTIFSCLNPSKVGTGVDVQVGKSQPNLNY